jgi:hypothetical protein
MLKPGSAIYIFGPTGPAFGSFSVSLDSAPALGTFNASTTVDTYGTLLFFRSGLEDAKHQITLTNLVEGGLLAIDYIVATSATSLGAGGIGSGHNGGGGRTGVEAATTLWGGPPPSTVAPRPTAVFPGQGGTTGQGHNGAAGLAIGLSLGFVALVVRGPNGLQEREIGRLPAVYAVDRLALATVEKGRRG